MSNQSKIDELFPDFDPFDPNLDPDMFEDDGSLGDLVPRFPVEPGMLIVAAPEVEHPYFRRSVYLVTQCGDASHATCLRLNERTSIPVLDVARPFAPLVARPEVVFSGGPLKRERLTALAMTTVGADKAGFPHFTRITNRLVSVDLNAPAPLMDAHVVGMRVFSGYWVWRREHLDELVDEGELFIAHALPTDVISTPRADLWSMVLRRLNMPLPLFATYPEFLNDN